MYSNLASCVRVNGRLTDWFQQTAGVRQGDTLAPTLFAIYINDLAIEVKAQNMGVKIAGGENRSILMFADDIVLLSDTAENLQSSMDVLSEWSHKWMLKLSNEKTKVVHSRKASTPATEYTFNIGDTVIERTNSYRYLGLHINDTLDFNFGVSILSQSSSRALGTIISEHFSVGGFPHEPYNRMYDTLVAPVMNYAAEVWGAKNYDQCNTVQHRAMRVFQLSSKNI